MKIAIIGGGPVGLESALQFQEMGAEVVVFTAHEISRFHLFARHWGEQPCDGTWKEVTSQEGWHRLGRPEQFHVSEVPTLGEYAHKYFLPLLELEEIKALRKILKVDRVHKRILSPGESPQGHSRMADLFRVVYEYKTSTPLRDGVEQNLKEGGEREVLESFLGAAEQFEDFDLVVNATGPSPHFRPLGASGTWAIGEKRVGKEGFIFYGSEALNFWEIFGREQVKRVSLVGSGMWMARVLVELAPLLERGELSELHVITSQVKAFDKIKEKLPATLKDNLFSFWQREEKRWKRECEEVEFKIREWRKLPRDRREGQAPPPFPEPRLKVLAGYSVTSVDHLVDREGVFITCETEEWRRKGAARLVTLGTDRILGGHGLEERSPLFSGLGSPSRGDGDLGREPGFYALGRNKEGVYGLNLLHSQIEWVKKDMMKFFSKVEH